MEKTSEKSCVKLLPKVQIYLEGVLPFLLKLKQKCKRTEGFGFGADISSDHFFKPGQFSWIKGGKADIS